MKTINSKKIDNAQIPGNQISDKRLVNLIKEAEQGPFITLKEHQKKMNKWIQENSR